MTKDEIARTPAGVPLETGPVVIRDGAAWPCPEGAEPDALCVIPCTTGFVGALAPAAAQKEGE